MRTFTLILCSSLLCVSPAFAQSNESAVSVGLGAGFTHPYHGDFDFFAPAVEGGVRVGRGRVGVEFVVGQWRRGESQVFQDVVIQSPQGVLGTVERIEQTTTRVATNGEVNLLARAGVGRVRIRGGAGAGVMTMSRETRQVASGCSDQAASWCRPSESRFSNASFTFQGIGMVEAPLTDWLWVYGAGRLIVPTEDVGAMALRVVAGIRLVR